MIGSALAGLGEGVLQAALVGAVLVAGVKAAIVLLRRLPPGWRAGLWWLVAARVLLELAGGPAVEWRILRAKQPFGPSVEGVAAAQKSESPVEPMMLELTPDDRSSLSKRSSIDPLAALGVAWLIGSALALGAAARKSWTLAAIVRRAQPAADGSKIAALARARDLVGVTRAVTLVESDEVDSPFVYGLFAPTVVLPQRWPLAGEELELVLAHELAHVRRGDVWLALAPALARRLFFFHPLIRLAEREFALAVEAACDRMVVARRSATAGRYAQLLVRFAAGHLSRPAAAGAWPFAASSTRRRLEMLLDPRIDRRRLALTLPFVLLLGLGIAVPVRFAAAEPPVPPNPPVSVMVEPVAAPPAPPAGERWPAAPMPLAPLSPPPAESDDELVPLAPMAPPALPAAIDLAAADWLVLRDGDASLVLSASRSEQRLAETLAEENGGAVVLVGRDGEVLVGRDREAIDAVRTVLDRFLADAKEQRALAIRQAETVRQKALAQGGRARERAETVRLAAQRAAESDQLLAKHSSHRRLERLTELEAERLARLTQELDELSPELMEESRERLRVVAEHLAAVERELATVGEEFGRERERMQAQRLDEHQRVREEHTAELERLRQELDRMRSRRDAERGELEREMRERARERSLELDRILEELIEDGHLDSFDSDRRDPGSVR